MTEPRLKTGLWVRAGLRQCSAAAIPAVVVRKGDEDAGAVLLKMRMGQGWTVLARMRSLGGEAGWRRGTGPAPVDEAAADAYIARQIGYDSDLWVVEIEDPSGMPPFGGPLMS